MCNQSLLVKVLFWGYVYALKAELRGERRLAEDKSKKSTIKNPFMTIPKVLCFDITSLQTSCNLYPQIAESESLREVPALFL